MLMLAASSPLQANPAVLARTNPAAGSIAKASNLSNSPDLLSGQLGPHLPDIGSRNSSRYGAGPFFSSERTDFELRWRQRTQDAGGLHLEAKAARRGPLETSEDRTEQFVVNQYGRTSDNAWRVDNTVGQQRIRNQPLIGSGYLYSLPDTPFQGIAARSYNHDTEISWTMGQPGVVKGNKIKSFEATTGMVTGLSGRRTLTRNWRVGAQSWMLSAPPKARDQYNLSGALEYVSTNKRHRHALHMVEDNEQRWGSWLDNEHNLGPWRQRYGIYHFEPRLHWLDKPMAEDREGMYWRTDRDRGQAGWFTGMELERTNVQNAPKIAGLIRTFGFVGLRQRFNSLTAVGGSFRAGIERQGSAAPAPDALTRKLKLFVERESPMGISRFGARFFGRTSEKNPEEQRTLFWEQAWLNSETSKLKTSLGVMHLAQGDRSLAIPTTGFKLKYALARGYNLEASMNYFGEQPGRPEEDAASFATLGLNWEVVHDWCFGVNGRWDGEVSKEDDPHRDFLNRIFLTFAYEPGADY